MAKKSTYKPKTNVKYGKGGKTSKKNSKKKGKYVETGNHYSADNGGFDPIGMISNFLGTIFGVNQMQEMLGSEDFDDIYPDGLLQSAIDQQNTAGATGVDLATGTSVYDSEGNYVGPGLGTIAPQESSYLTSYLNEIPGSITRPPDLTRTSITKPKKVSTEFVENIQDTVAQQTAGVLGDVGRTGKFSGIKDILGSADQAAITAQEKGAAMDADYQKQLTDIDKFEAQALTDQEKFEQSQLTDIEKFEEGLTSQITQAIGQQDFQGQQDVYDLAGQAGIQSAIGGGEMEASVLGGIIDLQGQQAAATADLMGDVIEIIMNIIFPDILEEGGKINKKEYTKGGKNEEMMEAGEAEVTPGEFSHETNPIDIVRNEEKIGEMTGGEVIMPPDDVIEFEELLASGDKNGVFNKLDELFDKWEEEALSHQQKLQAKESLKAAVGAKMGYKPKSKIKYKS
mgnify:FL=1